MNDITALEPVGRASLNRIVLQFMKDGSVRVHSDEPIQIFAVDENCDRDRVFQHADGFASIGSVDAVLGSNPIGFSGDGSRSDAVAHVLGGRRPTGARS